MPPDDLDRAAMFSRIAPRYDRLNSIMSWGQDSAWRRALIRHLPEGWQPRGILDVCCGTGALLEMLEARFPAAETIGLDFSPGMLHQARLRALRRGLPPPALILGDQNSLPFPGGRFDLVTNAFGLRNSHDPERSLAEMRRVLAPDGIVAVIELTRPPGGLFNRLILGYLSHIAPLAARCLGGDIAAYTYLPSSVRSFLSRDEMAALVARIVGGRVSVIPLLGSVVSLFLVVARER